MDNSSEGVLDFISLPSTLKRLDVFLTGGVQADLILQTAATLPNLEVLRLRGGRRAGNVADSDSLFNLLSLKQYLKPGTFPALEELCVEEEDLTELRAVTDLFVGIQYCGATYWPSLQRFVVCSPTTNARFEYQKTGTGATILVQGFEGLGFQNCSQGQRAGIRTTDTFFGQDAQWTFEDISGEFGFGRQTSQQLQGRVRVINCPQYTGDQSLVVSSRSPSPTAAAGVGHGVGRVTLAGQSIPCADDYTKQIMNKIYGANVKDLEALKNALFQDLQLLFGDGETVDALEAANREKQLLSYFNGNPPAQPLLFTRVPQVASVSSPAAAPLAPKKAAMGHITLCGVQVVFQDEKTRGILNEVYADFSHLSLEALAQSLNQKLHLLCDYQEKRDQTNAPFLGAQRLKQLMAVLKGNSTDPLNFTAVPAPMPASVVAAAVVPIAPVKVLTKEVSCANEATQKILQNIVKETKDMGLDINTVEAFLAEVMPGLLSENESLRAPRLSALMAVLNGNSTQPLDLMVAEPVVAPAAAVVATAPALEVTIAGKKVSCGNQETHQILENLKTTLGDTEVETKALGDFLFNNPSFLFSEAEKQSNPWHTPEGGLSEAAQVRLDALLLIVNPERQCNTALTFAPVPPRADALVAKKKDCSLD